MNWFLPTWVNCCLVLVAGHHTSKAEDTRTVAQPDVLLQRVNTEGTGVAHRTVDGPRSAPRHSQP